jgi:hypothetical protein
MWPYDFMVRETIPKYFQVSEKIPLTKMDEKYDRVLKYCEHEVDHVFKLFRKQKEDPPLPRNFPPIAGKRMNAILYLERDLCYHTM